MLLQHYVEPSKCYALDLESGATAETVVRSDAWDITNTAGFGAFRTVGLLHRSGLFVAAYVDENTLLVRIGKEVFDLSERDFEGQADCASALYEEIFNIEERSETLCALSTCKASAALRMRTSAKEPRTNRS